MVGQAVSGYRLMTTTPVFRTMLLAEFLLAVVVESRGLLISLSSGQKGKTMPKKAAADTQADEPKAVSETGRDPHPPDPSGAPMSYDPRGDAHPLTHDPLLAPEAQQPGESEADYRQRVGLPPRGQA